MQRDLGRIFFPVATGSGVGALVGLEIAQSAQVLYWWGLVIGVLVGGLSAYLLGEWQQIVRAIPEAYRRVRGYRPSKEAWKYQALIWMLRFSRATIVALFLGLIPFFFAVRFGLNLFDSIFSVSIFSVVMLLLFGAVVLNLSEEENSDLPDMCHSLQNKDKEQIKCLLRFWFPPFFLFHLMRGMGSVLVSGIRSIVRSLPRVPGVCLEGLKWSWDTVCNIWYVCTEFLLTFVELIHSTRRVIRAIYAIVGALVGFLAGSALIGAVAGGLLAEILGYQLIHKRLMHLS